MQICVLGAGSLGSVIGGVLAGSGHAVTLVSRNGAHVQAVRERGLVLTNDQGRLTAAPDASISPVELPIQDLLIVLVKSFDTLAAVESARPVIADDTVVLTLQNGVGCEEIIAGVVGADRVIAGRTFIGGRLLEPGIVEYGITGRRTVLGELDGAITERLQRIGAAFDGAGLAVDLTTDIVAMMWEKLFVNVSTGAWSALTGLPYGELSIHPEVEEMAVATVAEAMAVARALGIEITTTDPAVPWRRAWQGLPDGFKASMLQSIERGSRTEVDVIHGAVCAGGRRAGVATPINDTLLAAMHGLERRIELNV
jgi:2-dehydropantoate 2-reductase